MMNRQFLERFSLWVALLVAASCSWTCGGQKVRPTGEKGAGEVEGEGAYVEPADAEDGLTLRIENGDKLGVSSADGKNVKTQPLSGARYAAIMKKLPKLPSEKSLAQRFAMRSKSIPAPRPGETVKTPFPLKEKRRLTKAQIAAANDKGPLRLLRHAPEGTVNYAANINLTFSQPMVDLTTQDEAKKSMPAKLDPQPAGQWRWLGTKTLTFDPKTRFPGSTKYTVVIPKGTKSKNGGKLEKEERFSFETSRLRLVSRFPGHGPQRRDVVFGAQFDQKIDREKVLSNLKVTANGDPIEVRLASKAEMEKSQRDAQFGYQPVDHWAFRNLNALSEEEKSSRQIFLRAKKKLPADAHVVINFKKGTKSLEGPLGTAQDQSFYFRTYSPLTINSHNCDRRKYKCTPETTFYASFNNPLDNEKFKAEYVTLDPKPDYLSVSSSYSSVQMAIRGKANTTYRVTFSKAIADQFGQKLGRDETLEFYVGEARPMFNGPSGLVISDPHAKVPGISVFSHAVKEVKITVMAVKPEQYPAYMEFLSKRSYGSQRNRYKLPPFPVVEKKLVRINDPDVLEETRVNISKALKGKKYGHALVYVEPNEWPNRNWRPRVEAWVQKTDIGIDAFDDGEDLLVWTTRLRDGKPLSDVSIKMNASKGKGSAPMLTKQRKDKASTTFALPSSSAANSYLLAKMGDDAAILPAANYWGGGHWGKRGKSTAHRVYASFDRGIYKPKEEVHLKGFTRDLDLFRLGDMKAPSGGTFKYTVRDPRGAELKKGTGKISALGGFDLSFKLPDNANLGHASVMLNLPHGTSYHQFQIQEFRTPEYNVKVEVNEGPHVLGRSAELTGKASYYSGGGLPGATSRWNLTAEETAYSPPEHDQYVFGDYHPWWGWFYWQPKKQRNFKHENTTDTLGESHVETHFVAMKPARPARVVANLAVEDVNRQAWSGSANFLVHPSTRYVGLKVKRPFVKRGDKIEVEGVVTDIDGKQRYTDAPLTIVAERSEWRYKNGKYEEEIVEKKNCELRWDKDKDGKDIFHCDLPTGEGGRYQVRAEVKDAQNRKNETLTTVWVAGHKPVPNRNVEEEKAHLIPDKKEYKPGDKAQIFVQAPFKNAQALLTLQRNGLIEHRRFHAQGR